MLRGPIKFEQTAPAYWTGPKRRRHVGRSMVFSEWNEATLRWAFGAGPVCSAQVEMRIGKVARHTN